MYLGRYLQIGTEIMRVSAIPSSNSIQVIRGALGSDVSAHQQNRKIRAIDPRAVELRRPSILRASGHTFEYLGYGPGNYSTALPQLQVRQLPENEIFLVQSQETSAGQVVYTGMSDNGDFYIGNTKYSATSGTQTTFDVPIPTVAGEDGGNLSVVFDEVFINKRLFVAGGETKLVLSQFDGPTKFTNDVNIQAKLAVSGELSTNKFRVTSTDNSTSSTAGGAVQVSGGAGVVEDIIVGGDLHVDGTNSVLYTDVIYNRLATNPKIALEIGRAHV